ncbi:2,3-diaminopropionate biosynthesis protein SbnB [Paenibacillus sp. y28]|uniref:2,3-diaminopropionate biosynthesis protein SbnB n=1 Tax=Paenibacillus sp. y28 TaxID=3129110 RepID=UPI00301A272C
MPLYLNDNHIRDMGTDWERVVACLEEVVSTLLNGDYAQPVKPYLRYGNAANRIIAMPAYVGGKVGSAGLKWIASFPGNSAKRLPRAHSVTVLSEAETGRPAALLNTALISAIRTAGVTGMLLKRLLDCRQDASGLAIGIIGFGPIGRMHLEMCLALFQHRIAHIRIYDPRGVQLSDEWHDAQHVIIETAASWEEAYTDADIVLTCTVAKERYITRKPKPGSLLLHVSLRDYCAEALEDVNVIVVDDWEEVCRENTDIEMLHLTRGLGREQTVRLAEVIAGSGLDKIRAEDTLLFCPMGMAVFDIGLAHDYMRQAVQTGTGQWLE